MIEAFNYFNDQRVEINIIIILIAIYRDKFKLRARQELAINPNFS